MPYVIKAMKKRNIVGVDVHKVEKPKVAEMGGVGILLGVTVGSLVLFVLPESLLLVFMICES